MKIFSLLTLLVLSVLLFGCGSNGDASNAVANKANGVNSNEVNTGKTNAPGTNSSNVDSKLENISDAVLELPQPRPVEKGKKQSFTGITVDVPADWKALKSFNSGTASGISFQSPGGDAEALKVMVGRSYEAVEGDMQTVFQKDAQKKVYSKIMLREIGGTLGILYADLKADASPDYLRWETFPPPDLKGYAVRRYVQIHFPNGTYEQNKQQIADILFSSRVEN